MPIFSASVTSPTQFDGLTAATGLFDPAETTGGVAIQVRINSISFSGPTAITSWALSSVDPDDDQVTLLLNDTTTEFAAGGPHGFMIMPTNANKAPWRLALATIGMVGTGVFKIDFDFELSEG